METAAIKQLIEQGLNGATAEVHGDGSHFDATIVYAGFEGLNTVKQHQAVYALLNEHIQSNDIHALSLKTYTPQQWETAHKLNVSGA